MAHNIRGLAPAAVNLLTRLANGSPPRSDDIRIAGEIEQLLAADLVQLTGENGVQLTDAGKAYLRRRTARRSGGDIDPFLAQHMQAVTAVAQRAEGRVTVKLNEAESPLGWLARRKGRDGAPMISPEQLLAGERLRAEFTRGHLTPRITSNWSAASAPADRGSFRPGNLSDTVIAARQRVHHALEAVGPEFSGLLLDVCCFLKGIEDVERERQWPARSGKIVLQLGLDRLARHYGLSSEARGRSRRALRSWAATEDVPS
jgi:Domain of unknown function (DUF6456)